MNATSEFNGSDICQRRNFLGLTVDDLSSRTGIHAAVLTDFERSLPASTHLDALIEEALLLPPGAIRGRVPFLAAPETATSEIARIALKLIDRMFAPRQLTSRATRLMIVMQRYGALGDELRKYRVIGERCGVSEADGYQIVQRCLLGVPSTGLDSQPIRDLSLALERMLPARLDSLSEYFRPLLGTKLSLSSLNRFATDFLGGPIFNEYKGIAFSKVYQEAYQAVLEHKSQLAPVDGSIKLAVMPRLSAPESSKIDIPTFEDPKDKYLIGTKIALRRYELGLTVDDLATRLGESPTAVRRQELHVFTSPGEDSKWEAALEVEPGWLRLPIDRQSLAEARAFILSGGVPIPTGARVRERREELGLSVEEVSARSSLHPAILSNFEASLPESTHLDEAIEAALFLPPGAIRRAIPAPSIRHTASDEMTILISQLLTLEEKPRTKVTLERNVQMIQQRYGVFGEGISSFGSISEKHGLTSSRVQQIVSDLLDALPIADANTPVVSTIRATINPMLPARTDRLTEHFRPLLGPLLSMSSLNNFAQDFLAMPLFHKSERIAYPLSDRGIPESETAGLLKNSSSVGLIARYMARRIGAVNVHVVARLASEECGSSIHEEDVGFMLKERYEDFSWLNKDSGWGWFGPGHISVPRTWILQMLAVAEWPVSFGEIAAGLVRGRINSKSKYDFDKLKVPDDILQLILVGSPEIKQDTSGQYVIDDDVRSEVLKLLSEPEILLVGEIRKANGIAKRTALRSALVGTGKLGGASFTATITYSPLFRPLGGTRWTFIGAVAKDGYAHGVTAQSQ